MQPSQRQLPGSLIAGGGVKVKTMDSLMGGFVKAFAGGLGRGRM